MSLVTMFICLTYKHDHYIWCPDRCYVLVMPLEGRARETKRVEEEKRLKKSSAHQALCDEIGALEQRLSTLRVVTYSSCTSKSGPVVCVVMGKPEQHAGGGLRRSLAKRGRGGGGQVRRRSAQDAANDPAGTGQGHT